MSAMGGGFGLRTIWITLRALNYTGRIFDEVIRDVGKLIGREIELTKRGQEMVDGMIRFVQAGVLFSTLAQMSAQNILNMAMATQIGAEEMSELQQQMEEAKIAIADTFYEILKSTGILNVLKGALDLVKENKLIQQLVFAFLALTVAVTGIIGSYFIFVALNKAVAFWSSILIGKEITLGHVFHTLAAKMGLANISMKQLAISSALAFGAFGAMFLILKDMHPAISAAIAILLALAAAFIKVYIAESFATLGVAAIAGAAGAAVAAGYAMSQGFQHGTRSAPYTGLAMIHQGEVIYNPNTGLPTQIGKDLEGDMGKGPTIYETRIAIENLHTKADEDDIDQRLGRKLWRNAKARR